MLIINNRFLSLYDYNFLLLIEKIFSVNQKGIQRKMIGKSLRKVSTNRRLVQRPEKELLRGYVQGFQVPGLMTVLFLNLRL